MYGGTGKRVDPELRKSTQVSKLGIHHAGKCKTRRRSEEWWRHHKGGGDEDMHVLVIKEGRVYWVMASLAKECLKILHI